MINIQFNDVFANDHYLLFKDRLLKRVSKILKLRHIGRVPNRVILDLTSTKFLTLLTNELSLKRLIVSKPDDLNRIIKIVSYHFPDIVKINTVSNKVVQNLFIDSCYDHKDFDKLKFIQKINRDTCVYCNRNYTYSLVKKDLIKPEIDHFYPKSIYPFLGMSYYNLIPSCSTCNGFYGKKEQDPNKVGLTNPYLIKSSDFKFTYELRTINILNPLIDPSCVTVSLKTKNQGHLDVFKLDKLYEKHTDHVLELIIKSKLKYTDKYRKYLNNFKRFNFSNDEINRMILGNYSQESDIHKRPLAKLYQDIGTELGLIKSTNKNTSK